MVAGEHSGDVYGGFLVEQIKKCDPYAEFRGLGGDNMAKQGCRSIFPIHAMAVMGIAEVLYTLATLIRVFQACKREIANFSPDVLVLIDYPGMNLRLARWAKKQNIPVVYYIPPKVWAWGEKRVNILRQSVDELLITLPFEIEFYKNRQIPHHYVGHPMVELINRRTSQVYFPIVNENIIAVMPGSRVQEIRRILPVVLRVTKRFPDCVFVVIKSANLPDDVYDAIRKKMSYSTDQSNVIFARNLSDTILRRAKLGIIKSGTASLEACLYKLPQIVCYKTSVLTGWVARKFLKVPFVSLPNLIAGREIVPELLQSNMNEKNIQKHVANLLADKDRVTTKMQKEYEGVLALLTKGGIHNIGFLRAAQIICEKAAQMRKI